MMSNFVDPKLSSYEIHHAGAERRLRDIGNMLKAIMLPGWGFTLFLFEYGDEIDKGSMFYLSSSDRADMIKVLKEFIEKQEGGQ